MGYIKLFRKIQEWGWYDDPNTLALWIHLLIDANWKDGMEWHGETVPRGSLITSINKLSAESGLTIKQVRTCLSRLAKSGEIVKDGANQWTKITICNYDTYQSFDEDEGQTNGKQTANEGQALGKQGATIEESNKGKREEEKKPSNDGKERSRRFVKPSVDDIRAYCIEKHYDIDPEHFFNFYESKGWVVGKSPMKDWKAAVRNWVAMNKERNPQSSSQSSPSPQVAPTPSREEAMQKATHPTQEEITRMYNKFFLPVHPMNEGETKDEYKERIQPFWEREYKAWIERRVTAVNNKY